MNWLLFDWRKALTIGLVARWEDEKFMKKEINFCLVGARDWQSNRRWGMSSFNKRLVQEGRRQYPFLFVDQCLQRASVR